MSHSVEVLMHDLRPFSRQEYVGDDDEKLSEFVILHAAILVRGYVYELETRGFKRSWFDGCMGGTGGIVSDYVVA